MKKRKKWFKDKEYEKKQQAESINKHACKHCGHMQLIPSYKKYCLCKICNHWVFRNDKDELEYRKDEQKYEFKRRMKEQLNRK